MTNYRIYRVDTVTSSSVVLKMNNAEGTSTTMGYNSATSSLLVYPASSQTNSTGSTGQFLNSVWGIMTSNGVATTGSLYLEGGGSLLLQSLIPGQIYPCRPIAIQLSAGTASLLS